MKLTELFTSEKQITDSGKVQQNIVKSDAINRQIRSMVPGQTIQGEVVAKNGAEVQIRLSEDFVMQARLEQNLNLEVGKTMTFEVKNNGRALTLSPLFTNVATDATVLKALGMASIPVNEATISMTQQMMEAGLSVNRNSLQQVFREMNLFPQSEVGDIVSLHKLQMPVNENNVAQMASYKNLTHQLVTGLNNILDAVPEMFNQMMESGNTEGAVKLYQQLVLLAEEIPVGQTGEGNSTTAGFPNDMPLVDANGVKTVITEGLITEGELVNAGLTGEETIVSGRTAGVPNTDMQGTNMPQGMVGEGIIQEGVLQEGTLQEGVPQDGKVQNNFVPDATAQEGNIQGNGLPENTVSQQLSNLMGKFATETDVQKLLTQIHQIWKESGGDKELWKPLLQHLKNQWTITPEEVAHPENVEKLYSKLNRQLKNLSQTLENAGQTSTSVYKAVTNLTQNLDFMQQINQMYTYVQLPLRLQQGEAHGDLYVYTNKKHLSAKDGQISALLHLDMEHLGPVDVYVTMMQSNVKTQFYLKDDEMLDFMMGHMDILTERLKKRGYQCDYEMQVREQEEGSKSSIEKLLQQENHVPLVNYAFDVRT